MKQNISITNIILTAMIILLLLTAEFPPGDVQAAPVNPANQTQACDSSRTVHVTGSAMINITPDRALIQLGVQSNGVSPDAVQIENSKTIRKVIDAIKGQGVDSKDIATDIYVIEPIYEDYDSLYIKGYRINNMVAITLRDITKTSAILGAALKAGANQVIDVEFFTSELRKYRDQARKMAMQAANEKAQALAKAAGAETGCVLSINENSWSYYNGWWYGRNQNLWTQNTIQNTTPSNDSESSMGDEPVSLGQISVKAEVSVSYGLY